MKAALRAIKLESLGLKFKTRVDAVILEVLDQRVLPDVENWIRVESAAAMVDLIKTLAVRGAPLIGVAAALALAVEESKLALDTDSIEAKKVSKLKDAAAQLRAARPTAVNLMWAMDRMVRVLSSGNPLMAEAVAIFNEDVEMCERMGDNGASLIKDGDGVMTICNTGGLATVGIGTAFAVMRKAHEYGVKFHVYACETRPLLQGGRLTTWELAKCGIPHTLITDGMAATLMRQGKIQSVFTGADRVSVNGDYANKIGTYSLAVLAKHHEIPFYAVAPVSTVDASCADGSHIEIEQRPAAEVRGFVTPGQEVRWAPRDVEVYNPSFDVTPVELVSKFVLDRGVMTPDEYRTAVKRGF
ncbi:S-methyl-5-thioribose-1-phosphate isomerase [soil metagenome]